VRLLLAPAFVVLAVFGAALAALFRWSLLEFVPGSLQTGGLTLANFRAVLAGQYVDAVRDTVVLSALTTGLTLVLAYPVAYALDLSSDNSTWKNVAVGLGADVTKIWFTAQSARYVKIRQIGSGYDHWWGIQEINVYQ